MGGLRSRVGSLRRVLGGRQRPYEPERYWEERAAELILTYDDPTSWPERRWNIAASPEEELVPRLVADYGVESVLVVGAGTGRQYAYLEPLGVEVRGFDLSPTLVEECTTRYPTITTVRDSVTDADDQQLPADLVLSVTVLQHVPDADIGRAIAALKKLAQKLVVILEFTRFGGETNYIFAHDYEQLMSPWPLVERVLVAEGESERTECLVWTRP
jgi:SAM-dependent methyltransferase